MEQFVHVNNYITFTVANPPRFDGFVPVAVLQLKSLILDFYPPESSSPEHVQEYYAILWPLPVHYLIEIAIMESMSNLRCS